MGRKKRGSRDEAHEGSPDSSHKSESNAVLRSGRGEKLPRRLEAVRKWIAAGGHNRPEVAEAVARRILARGELRDERDADSMRPYGRSDSLIH